MTLGYTIMVSKLHIVCNNSLYRLIKFIIKCFGSFTANIINHTKISSLTKMLVFIKSTNNIWLLKFSELIWSCYYRNPISCDLKRNPNCFYHQLNHFASGLILYTSMEAFHGVNFLLRSKIGFK